MKAGPCPACGFSDGQHDLNWDDLWRVVCVPEDLSRQCGMEGPLRKTKAEAIAAWNSIRARVLREAKDLIRDDENCTDVEYAVFLLREAAARAERGES